MSARMDLVLLGDVFTDELHADVGAGTFQLLHDWFIGQELVIRDAPAGGGNLLVEGVDYTLATESLDLSARVTDAVGAGRNVYKLIAVINVAYQAGDLYFSGKYVADSVQVEDFNDQPILAASWQRSLLVSTGPFEVKPWNKAIVAMLDAALYTGTADTDVSMALKDVGANFANAAAGDMVWNTASHEAARILYKSGADTLYLTRDIFPAGTEAYAVYAAPALPEEIIELTGALLDGNGTVVADSNTLNHLTDADGTAWTGLVAVGDWAMNLATGRVARVEVVAAHDLTLAWDCFPNGNEAYMIFAGTVTVADADSPINGWVLPEMNVSGRVIRGGLSGGFGQLDAGQGHYHANLASIFNASAGAKSDPGAGASFGTFANNPIGSPITDGTNGTPRTADETRMRNVEQVFVMRIK
jgi:hypothetical protein